MQRRAKMVRHGYYCHKIHKFFEVRQRQRRFHHHSSDPCPFRLRFQNVAKKLWQSRRIFADGYFGSIRAQCHCRLYRRVLGFARSSQGDSQQTVRALAAPAPAMDCLCTYRHGCLVFVYSTALRLCPGEKSRCGFGLRPRKYYTSALPSSKCMAKLFYAVAFFHSSC